MRGHHTTDKVVMCGVCNEKFTDLTALEEHELDHDINEVVPLIVTKQEDDDVIQLTEEIIDSTDLGQN